MCRTFAHGERDQTPKSNVNHRTQLRGTAQSLMGPFSWPYPRVIRASTMVIVRMPMGGTENYLSTSLIRYETPPSPGDYKTHAFHTDGHFWSVLGLWFYRQSLAERWNGEELLDR